jgi:hypothetical protein
MDFGTYLVSSLLNWLMILFFVPSFTIVVDYLLMLSFFCYFVEVVEPFEDVEEFAMFTAGGSGGL